MAGRRLLWFSVGLVVLHLLVAGFEIGRAHV